MSDLVRELGGRAATRYAPADDDRSPAPGRHAFNEDAVLTPIFHALTRGGWRSRQHEPAAAQRQPAASDPIDAFRRDPLTAPIPIQALVPVPAAAPSRRRSTAGAHAAGVEARQVAAEHGRHHLVRNSMRTGWRG